MDNVKRKDPDAKLDYPFDWRAKTNGHGESDWLAPNETIVSYEITVDEGITLKRILPRAKGRADRISKRTCHITIKVGE